MIFSRIIYSVVFVSTVLLSADPSCFAASPGPISPDEAINSTLMASDDDPITFQTTENNSRIACFPGQTESLCIDSQETLPLTDTDNLIALWNAFDLPNKR